MISKDALEYLVELGVSKDPLVEACGRVYSKDNLILVKDPKPTAIEATTLTALVDYLRSNIDDTSSSSIFIHVVNPAEVVLYSDLRDDKDREAYIRCRALLPNNIAFNRFIDVESFNVMLQSSFVDNEDRTILLKVTGLIQDKEVTEVGDNGISQQVTMKTGVAKVGNVKVPNPVVLAPYRTFPEIEQPESKFIFRMQSGPAAALYEADGGAWRNEAMKRIKDYLFIELIEKSEMENLEIIS